MINILFQALILASTGFLAVGSMMLVITLLMTGENASRAIGYFLGYFLSYLSIGTLIAVIGARIPEDTLVQVRVFFSFLIIFLGMFLLYMGARNLRKPVTGETKGENRFIKMIDNLTPLKAFELGITVTIVNFKNLALFLAIISVITTSDLLLVKKIILVLASTVVFCSSVIIPIIVYLLLPSRRDLLLNRVRQLLDERSREISIIVPTLFGFLLVIKGVVDLT